MGISARRRNREKGQGSDIVHSGTSERGEFEICLCGVVFYYEIKRKASITLDSILFLYLLKIRV